VKTLVPQRDQTLQDELRKQQNNEALRRQFADKSNQVGPWIEKQMDAVSAIGMGMQARKKEIKKFGPPIRPRVIWLYTYVDLQLCNCSAYAASFIFKMWGQCSRK
jgi:hypothetical protein